MNGNGQIRVRRWASPCGELLLGSSGGALCLCDWTASRRHAANLRRIAKALRADIAEGDSPVVSDAIGQLEEYLLGRRTQFSVPLLTVGTDFQKDVWQRLLTIPYGTTTTYAALAAAMDRPQSVRAVANACGSNAISILIPCHRVVGSAGALTGYAGGIPAKQSLLEIEKKIFRDF